MAAAGQIPAHFHNVRILIKTSVYEGIAGGGAGSSAGCGAWRKSRVFDDIFCIGKDNIGIFSGQYVILYHVLAGLGKLFTEIVRVCWSEGTQACVAVFLDQYYAEGSFREACERLVAQVCAVDVDVTDTIVIFAGGTGQESDTVVIFGGTAI